MVPCIVEFVPVRAGRRPLTTNAVQVGAGPMTSHTRLDRRDCAGSDSVIAQTNWKLSLSRPRRLSAALRGAEIAEQLQGSILGCSLFARINKNRRGGMQPVIIPRSTEM